MGLRKSADYNLVVIGAGSGGLVSAYIAAALKARVALIEKNKMGGDCLNTGCVPSKALLKIAKVLSLQHRAADFGLKSITIEMNFSDVMDQVRKVIRQLEPHDSVERYQSLGVSCFQGAGKILSPYEVSANNRVFTTRSIIIASGARPSVPDIDGILTVNPLTSDNVWELRDLPKNLLVLGGGAIGCELAQAFSRLGSKVTLIERNDRILPREDRDVGELVQDQFRREGIRLILGAQAKRFSKENGSYFLECESLEEKISFDRVIVALGRKPNVEGLGLEEVGVQLRKSGTIETDAKMRTSVKNIYACGDVTGPFQFTHFASLTGTTAAVNALFSPFQQKVDYSVFPWAMYTDPEVARVGLGEEEAKQRGIEVEVTHHSLKGLDRAVTDGEAHGFLKVLTVKGKDRVVGATIVGPSAGELIMEFTLAIKHGIGLNQILGTIHPYPTLMEANRALAGNWKRAHAPRGALAFLAKVHALRRKYGF